MAMGDPVDLRLLWEALADPAPEFRGGHMPAALRRRYGGDLAIPVVSDGPTLIANFVSSLDGVVAFDVEGASGGGEVSGFFEPDRFVMALLRTLADIVVVGAGTVRAAPTHEWTARHVHRSSAELTTEWRRRLGLAPQPTLVVVSSRGDLDLRHPGLSAPDAPAMILTTEAGATRLDRQQPPADRSPNLRVEAVTGGPAVPAEVILDRIRATGARVVLCEGGPHLFANLLAAGAVDELFLTLAPQLAGRSADRRRLALVEGVSFEAGAAPWSDLRSVRRAGDHLFLRYTIRGRE
jgi:riboflavin biosynthesis pyrimidine reductase